jgi:prepilin-type N-terminal cleavage/methylation domain-containing protein
MTGGQGLKRARGFTLIEVAIVMVIGSILLTTATALLLTYTKKTQISTTQKRLAAIDEALQLYLHLNGRYPCVADPAAALDSATFGREYTTCSSAPAAAGGRDGRDVRIGAVPVRTLNLPDDFAADAWGGRFTMAMTAALASPAGTYSRDEGGIYIVTSADPYDLTDINDSVITPPGSAHYAIVSHGPNGSGAWPVGGGGAPACPAGNLEEENCNGDAIFRQTLITGTADNAAQFDDMVAARASSAFGFEVPSGAVMAFNLSACPEGWISFSDASGRTIVGAGVSYSVGEQGGEEDVALTQGEVGTMDATHTISGSVLNPTSGGVTAPFLEKLPANVTPHENRMPYHVLLYCEKT